MDLRLPGMNGSETIHEIRGEFPDARMVMISTYVCDEEIYGALQAGAMAYLVKSVQREELTASDPQGGRSASATSRPRSRRAWPAGCRGRSCRPASSTCCACSSAAAATAKSPSRSRHHGRHGQAAREQHPGQARRRSTEPRR